MELNEESVILVTGGTGSFGSSFVRTILKNYSVKKVIVYSRDEIKQWEMQKQVGDEPRIRFFLGDVRDEDRLKRAMFGVTHVVHAAALKIVPWAEYNPFECVKTNVIGVMNVINTAIDAGVSSVVALSTDKASAPANVYGASKLLSDKLIMAANYSYSDGHTKFSVVRYGNVLGSRGSVIPAFIECVRCGVPFSVTDERMTRFIIDIDQAVDFVIKALSTAHGGETFVKKLPSISLKDIVAAVAVDHPIQKIGLRPGEKMHEQMIGPEDSARTFDFGDHYRIVARPESYPTPEGRFSMPDGFVYSSERNDHWWSREDLARYIEDNNTELLGKA